MLHGQHIIIEKSHSTYINTITVQLLTGETRKHFNQEYMDEYLNA